MGGDVWRKSIRRGLNRVVGTDGGSGYKGGKIWKGVTGISMGRGG